MHGGIELSPHLHLGAYCGRNPRGEAEAPAAIVTRQRLDRPPKSGIRTASSRRLEAFQSMLNGLEHRLNLLPLFILSPAQFFHCRFALVSGIFP